MNNNPNKLQNQNTPNLQNSQPFRQSIPENAILPTLEVFITNNNISKFKAILSSHINYLSHQMLSNLLLKCFYLYKNGKIYILRYISILLSYGADPNINIEASLDKNEQAVLKTPLMLAVENSDIALLKILLDNKSNVNYKDNYQKNCLYYFKGGKNDNEILKMLINQGVDINCRDYEGNTVLHYMLTKEGKEKTIYALLDVAYIEQLQTVNSKNKSVLEMIVEKYSGKSELKKMFECIKKKINIVKQDEIENETNNTFISNIETNEDVMFKLSSTKEKTFVKVKPQQVLLIDNGSGVSTCNMSTKELESINQKSNLYLKTLQDVNHKKVNENKLYQSKIAKLKNIILQKKTIISQLTQTFNSLSNSHNDKMKSLKAQYSDKLQTITTLKKQISNSNSNAFSFIRNQNQYQKKYSSQEFYSTPYITKQLQYDLLDFNKYVTNQITQKKVMFAQLISLIGKYVTESLGSDYSIKVYGSHATKLCLPWSDIDIVVSTPIFKSYTPLFSLYQYILSQNIFKQVHYIGKTQVPLIKIITNETFNNMNLDISLEDPKHYGVQCVNFVNEMVKKYEVLTPMTLAVKNILHQANLNDPYKGGLSSYGVLLLILNYLLIVKKEGKEIGISNRGNLFYDFLYYYGVTFDPSKGIIDISDRNDITFATQFQLQMMNGELVIVDPLNIKNNVGKNTRQFQNIKLAFMIGYRSAKECCECGCHYQYGNFCVNEEGVEHCLLKRMFNAVKRVSPDEWGK